MNEGVVKEKQKILIFLYLIELRDKFKIIFKNKKYSKKLNKQK